MQKLQIIHRDRDAPLLPARLRIREYAVHQHPAVTGKGLVGPVPEHGPTLLLERVEGLETDDPVDLPVELFPALQTGLGPPRRRDRGQPGFAALVVISAERDAEQRHSRLEIQLVQPQIQLGELRLLEGHVVVLEVRTGVDHVGVQEQREEVV